jgi:hypothetical protein
MNRVTTKILNHPYASAYLLQAPITTLIIAPTGSVAGNADYGVYTKAAAQAAYTVANRGTVTGGGVGISLTDGGRIINGTASAPEALITGESGVVLNGPATVANFGTVVATGLDGGPDVNHAYAGIHLTNGGFVQNGSTDGSKSSVEGQIGVLISGAAGTVRNFGTISTTSGSLLDAVFLENGGSLTNGTARNTTASLYGYGNAVVVELVGTVNNLGTIRGGGEATGHFGINLAGGGCVTNGLETDRVALISGVDAVASNARMTVRNFGLIEGSAIGVSIGGGEVINGSVRDKTATISGPLAVRTYGGVSVVTNFGTIEGTGDAGQAVFFSPNSASTLKVEAGSTIVGTTNGGNGTLDLASGGGTISSIGGGDIVASGSADPYWGFGTLEIGKGADFTLTGAGTIAAGGVASLDIEGALGVIGSLSAASAIKGGGTLAIVGGEADFNAGASLSVARVSVSGASALVDVATDLTYAGQWRQTGGTVAGSGDLDFTGAGDLFQNTTLDLAHTTISAASATLSGAIGLTGLLTVASPDLVIWGATELTGGGTLQLTSAATNAVIGSSKAALLTNVDDTIEGAGRLGAGALRLTNEAGGVVEGNTKAGLTIDTGASKIINAGLIEAYGVGDSLTVAGAVVNNGVLGAFGGALTVAGAVSGSGAVRIDKGGDATFGSAFSQDVIFVVSGTLTLADSQSFEGSISGFSKAGKTSLDLEDIAFGSHTKIFSSSTKAFSILTVTDGSHIAEIKLMGDYTGSSFAIASDGHGGTTVTDPPAVQAMASAMASFAPASSGSGAGSVPIQHPAATSLAKPPH